MWGVRPEVVLLEQNDITAVAFSRIGDPSVIPLWFGEGDETTPAYIREAAKTALDDGETFYVPTRGRPDLREAIRDYLEKLYDIRLGPDRISVPGASMMGVTIAANMALQQGDDAVIVSPHWPNIEMTCRVAGANIITVRQRESSEGWSLSANEIIDACKARTRCIFINSPCNLTRLGHGPEGSKGSVEFLS